MIPKPNQLVPFDHRGDQYPDQGNPKVCRKIDAANQTTRSTPSEAAVSPGIRTAGIDSATGASESSKTEAIVGKKQFSVNRGASKTIAIHISCSYKTGL